MNTTIAKTNHVNEPILPRITAGEAAAVEECLDRYGDLVWGLAKKFTRSHEDAEDAAQEIFMDVWRNAARYDASRAAESTFIAMIARRRLIDRMRRTNRRPQPDALENHPEIGYASSPAVIENKIKAKEAMKAMAQLCPEQRRLIALTVFDGLSHTEIAMLTGLPLGTVKAHIRRGLKRARRIMLHTNWGPDFEERSFVSA